MNNIPFPRQAPPKRKRFNKLALLILIVLVALIAFWWLKPTDSQTTHPKKGKTTSFNKKQFPINEPSSIWVVVNKGRTLPGAYVPPDLVTPNIPLRLAGGSPEMHLRQVAADALVRMTNDASDQNVHLMLASGYRSYSSQQAVYASEVAAYGQAQADRESARAGHSEHQTGLAADVEPASRICEVQQCFENTAEGKWLAANAYKYGFIIRYPKDKEAITGYEYEPWHIRYVGVPLAAQLHSSGQTLEQFFDLPIYASYPTSPTQL